MSKSRFVIVVATSVGLSGVAAADGYEYGPVGKGYAPPPVYDWSGLYIGANAGGAWGNSNLTTSVTGGFSPPNEDLVSSLDTLSLAPEGYTGGVQAGYNVQLGNVVFGIELDFNFPGLDKSSTGTFTFDGGGEFTLKNSIETDRLFTARPRVGYAFDRWMAYATGGVAVANIKYSSSLMDIGGLGAADQSRKVDSSKTGWTAGGGLEFAAAQTLLLRLEYLYADFGPVSMRSVGGNGAVFNQSADLDSHFARAGINFKIGPH